MSSQQLFLAETNIVNILFVCFINELSIVNEHIKKKHTRAIIKHSFTKTLKYFRDTYMGVFFKYTVYLVMIGFILFTSKSINHRKITIYNNIWNNMAIYNNYIYNNSWHNYHKCISVYP